MQSFVGSAAVDRRGRVYLTGTGLDLADRFLGVLRLTARGVPDSAFGRGGFARLPRQGFLAIPEAIAIQPDGRVVVAGNERFADHGPGCTYCSFLAVGRFTLGGRPDRTFGQDGVNLTRLRLSEAGNSLGLGLDRDGRIVVAGGIAQGVSGSSFFVARLLRSGGFDRGFAGRGYVVTDMGSGRLDDDYATALGIAPDGRIVVAGRSARDELEGGGTSGRVQFRFAVARFLP
jgi:uncharacterized delta-60 repeat protein